MWRQVRLISQISRTCLHMMKRTVITTQTRQMLSTTTTQLHHSLNLHQPIRKQSTSLKFDYEKISQETLDSICDFFDQVAEDHDVDTDYDVSLEIGVLTIKISKKVGTYVINKQTPNKQIWMSSPVSGPKRYDFVDSAWKYSHDGKFLHDHLETELSDIFSTDISMSSVAYCNPTTDEKSKCDENCY